MALNGSSTVIDLDDIHRDGDTTATATTTTSDVEKTSHHKGKGTYSLTFNNIDVSVGAFQKPRGDVPE